MQNKRNKLSKKERKEKQKQEELQRKEIVRLKGIEREKREKIKKKEKWKQKYKTKLSKLLKNLKLYGCLWMIIALIYGISSYGSSSYIEYNFQDVDNTFYVSDNASLLSDQLKREIIYTNLNYEDTEEKPQVVVITIPTLWEEDIDGYAFKVFNQLGIGDKDLDNGVLIILALEERKIRIEVGYGLEDVLTDSKAGRLIDEARPSLSQENFDEGIKYIFESVRDEVNKKYNYAQNVIKGNLNNELEYLNYEYEETFEQDEGDIYFYILVVLVLAGGCLILAGLIYIIDGLFCKGVFFTIVKWTLLAFGCILLAVIGVIVDPLIRLVNISSGRSSSFSSGGGCSSGGGGGSSGGGGASGGF